MEFGKAVEALKEGHRVTRTGWNGKGMWLALQRPDPDSKMTLPYIYMKTATDDMVPWLASQTDILAEDWGVVMDPADQAPRLRTTKVAAEAVKAFLAQINGKDVRRGMDAVEVITAACKDYMAKNRIPPDPMLRTAVSDILMERLRAEGAEP